MHDAHAFPLYCGPHVVSLYVYREHSAVLHQVSQQHKTHSDHTMREVDTPPGHESDCAMCMCGSTCVLFFN